MDLSKLYDNYVVFESDNIPEKELDKIESFKQFLRNTDWHKDLPENIKKLFEEYPPWVFYKCRCCLDPIRIKGLHGSKNGETFADSYSLKPSGMVYTGASHALKDLIKVKKWSHDDIKYIESLANKIGTHINALYRHPLGFTILMNDN